MNKKDLEELRKEAENLARIPLTWPQHFQFQLGVFLVKLLKTLEAENETLRSVDGRDSGPEQS